MSEKFLKGFSVAKKYVMHKMGRSTFTENPKVVARKEQLRKLQSLYEETYKKADQYSKDAAKCNRSANELAATLAKCVEEESDPKVREALQAYSSALAVVEQMRETMLTNLVSDFVTPLANMQEDLKLAKNLKSKYTNAMCVFETQDNKVRDLQNKPNNQFKLPQAERDLADSKDKAERTGREFAMYVKELEKRKNGEFVYTLNELVNLESKYHQDAAAALSKVQILKPSGTIEPDDDGDFSLPSATPTSINSSGPTSPTIAAPVALTADQVRAKMQATAAGESSTSSLEAGGSSRSAQAVSPKPPTDDTKYMKTLYDYKAEEDGELSFDVGQVITVLATDQSGWWYGELNGKEGMFPSPYCEPCDAP